MKGFKGIKSRGSSRYDYVSIYDGPDFVVISVLEDELRASYASVDLKTARKIAAELIRLVDEIEASA